MKILVAEDDLTSRTILTAVLRKWGFDPVAVEDGEKAWQVMLGTDAPSLAILDWSMPGMDGLEVCRKIRELETPNPPHIIILTAKGEKTDIVKGLNAGANDYVSKPYDNEELRARVTVGKRMVELQMALLKARDILAHQAMHDPLTGALNRRAILDGLNKELDRAKRQNARLSIGLFDIDHFKTVNDTYGHQGGDDVLCALVDAIQSSLRGYDLFGRYGGEEFLMVAPNSSGSGEERLYERLREQVADLRIPTRAGEARITVSIGVTGVIGDAKADALLAAADAALYRAKDDGRNRVVYAADM